MFVKPMAYTYPYELFTQRIFIEICRTKGMETKGKAEKRERSALLCFPVCIIDSGGESKMGICTRIAELNWRFKEGNLVAITAGLIATSSC